MDRMDIVQPTLISAERTDEVRCNECGEMRPLMKAEREAEGQMKLL